MVLRRQHMSDVVKETFNTLELAQLSEVVFGLCKDYIPVFDLGIAG